MAMPTVKTPPKVSTPAKNIAEVETAVNPPVAPPPVAKPTVVATKGVPAFDFDVYKKKFTEQKIEAKALFMLLTGKRTSGKSYCLGSCDGDLLLFYSRHEHHSYAAALTCARELGNKNAITPMYIDADDDGNIFDMKDAEKVWTRFSDRLDALIAHPDPASIFKYVAVDSLNAFERYALRRDNVLKATQYTKSLESTANLIDLVIGKLLRLQEKGVNILVTMASEVKEDKQTGALYLSPVLTGYRAADEVIGSFPDIAVTTSIFVEKDDGSMDEQYVFQFANAEGHKAGKKFSGEAVSTTFAPRLQAIPRYKLPQYFNANIGELQQFIKQSFEAEKA